MNKKIRNIIISIIVFTVVFYANLIMTRGTLSLVHMLIVVVPLPLVIAYFVYFLLENGIKNIFMRSISLILISFLFFFLVLFKLIVLNEPFRAIDFIVDGLPKMALYIIVINHILKKRII